MPDLLKDRLRGLRCRHARAYDKKTTAHWKVFDAEEELPSWVYPLRQRNPSTGKTAIWVNKLTTISIEDMEPNASATLIDEVQSHFYDEGLAYSHAWRSGDLILWDNLVLQHARLPFDKKPPHLAPDSNPMMPKCRRGRSRLRCRDLEGIRGALRASQSEMEALIERTAMSAFIREKKDFFVALFDATGDMIVGAYRPSFGDPVRPIFEFYPPDQMKPGDLYWYNDCYGSKGSVSHSPDQVFVAPIFIDGEIIAFAQSWAHFADIGGMRPGSISPDCTDIFQEGIIVPPVRLAEAGVVNDELLRVFFRNSRFPDMLKGDTRACFAAVRLGERRIGELAERFGADVVVDAFRQLGDRSEQAAVERLRETFQPGSYHFADSVDHDGQGNGPYRLSMELTVDDNGVVLDFSDSDDQAPGPINYLVNSAVPRAMLGMYLLAGDPICF